jgi:hypothetical protein
MAITGVAKVPDKAVNLGYCNAAVNLWLACHLGEESPKTANEQFLVEVSAENTVGHLREIQRQIERSRETRNRLHNMLRRENNEGNNTGQVDDAYVDCIKVHTLGIESSIFFSKTDAKIDMISHFLKYDTRMAAIRGFALMIGMNEANHALGIINYPDGLFYYDPNAPHIYRADNMTDVEILFNTALKGVGYRDELKDLTSLLCVFKIK